MTLFALAMISFVTERRGETRGSCRCLGTGPRNYGYRSNYYPGFARYEGVAEERKRPPSRADSRSVLLTVDEIDELSLSLSLSLNVSRNVPLPTFSFLAREELKIGIGNGTRSKKGREREEEKVG